MRTLLLRFVVGCLTFAGGAASSYLHDSFRTWKRWHHAEAKLESNRQLASTNVERLQRIEPTMPESLAPYNIEIFINNNPQANLQPLWTALGIRLETRRGEGSGLEHCGGCNAESFTYDFDEEPGSEVLLRVADRTSESFRYLIFKWESLKNTWKMILSET